MNECSVVLHRIILQGNTAFVPLPRESTKNYDSNQNESSDHSTLQWKKILPEYADMTWKKYKLSSSGRFCCVPNCNYVDDGISDNGKPVVSLHPLPDDPVVKYKWIKAIKKKGLLPGALVCSAHFAPGDFLNVDDSGTKALNSHAVPRFRLPSENEVMYDPVTKGLKPNARGALSHPPFLISPSILSSKKSAKKASPIKEAMKSSSKRNLVQLGKNVRFISLQTKSPSKPASPRVVLPTSRGNLARSTVEPLIAVQPNQQLFLYPAQIVPPNPPTSKVPCTPSNAPGMIVKLMGPPVSLVSGTPASEPLNSAQHSEEKTQRDVEGSSSTVATTKTDENLACTGEHSYCKGTSSISENAITNDSDCKSVPPPISTQPSHVILSNLISTSAGSQLPASSPKVVGNNVQIASTFSVPSLKKANECLKVQLSLLNKQVKLLHNKNVEAVKMLKRCRQIEARLEISAAKYKELAKQQKREIITLKNKIRRLELQCSKHESKSPKIYVPNDILNSVTNHFDVMQDSIINDGIVPIEPDTNRISFGLVDESSSTNVAHIVTQNNFAIKSVGSAKREIPPASESSILSPPADGAKRRTSSIFIPRRNNPPSAPRKPSLSSSFQVLKDSLIESTTNEDGVIVYNLKLNIPSQPSIHHEVQPPSVLAQNNESVYDVLETVQELIDQDVSGT